MFSFVFKVNIDQLIFNQMSQPEKTKQNETKTQSLPYWSILVAKKTVCL